ncbi:MAG: outer membrane beta-barrel protein [Proteobacteria bacterium]|nr:outer membrane beta-barrel protein [Pseudomonadota bacterium]
MSRKALAGIALLLTTIVAAPANAADPPAPAWQGFYFGGHVGGALTRTTFSDPDNLDGIFGGNVASPGFLAGLQLGYNWRVAPKWLVGVEAEGSILSSQGHNTCLQSSITFVGSDCKTLPREMASFTGRVGYLADPDSRLLVYGKAGLAWMRSQVEIDPNNLSAFDRFPLTGDPLVEGAPTNQMVSAWGWTIGAGIEYALTPRWSLDAGYQYMRFNLGTVPTPETVDVSAAGNVTGVPGGGASSVSQDVHVARVGLNYHFGSLSKAADSYGTPSSAEVPWTPGWEFEGGARYWYSSGSLTSANGSQMSLVSRLPYNHLEGHSGELFARLDAPFNAFIKGFVGLGGIVNGTMYDEDWALPNTLAAEPSGYEITQSDVNGTMNYLTVDVGYDVLRGRDHKVGLFVGYNRYHTVLNTLGCAQLVSPGSGVCYPTIANNVNAITETDTWNSLRLGVAADVELAKRLKLGIDLAYLPYVHVESLDEHKLRSLNFPTNGTGNGVQAEILLSYALTDAFNVGVGGRYWSMWTANGYLTDSSSYVMLETQRYGVFVQGSYRFGTP